MIATTQRVLRQLKHDKRTLALIFVVPCVLLSLLWWIYDGGPFFTQIAPSLLVLFPVIIMFLITSITTLRERSSGTLERLLTMPLSKLSFIGGYALAFGILATVQAVLASLLLVGPLGVDTAGPVWMLTGVAILDALAGVALGLFVSAFARTEFQAVQFFPALILPQFLLCGLLVPRDEMPRALELFSNLLPLSHAIDAIDQVATNTSPALLPQVAALIGFITLFLIVGAATLRRKTP